MADLNETAEWSEGIYQFETTDPVLGGAPNIATQAGMDNIPHLQLAQRTQWLKAQVDNIPLTFLARSEVGALLASNGWLKLPSGDPDNPLILQWMSGQSDATGRMTLTNPVAFPTGFISGIACEGNPAGWASSEATVWAFDRVASNATTSVAIVRKLASPIATGPAIAGTIWVIGS